MKRFSAITLAFALLLSALASCIRNDTPYPDIVAAIAALEVEGALDVAIDAESYEVVVTLAEGADITRVRINGIAFSDPAVTASADVVGVHDLSRPLPLTLAAYGNSCLWSIRAVRPVERHFAVSGQVGAAVIDAANRRVIAQVHADALHLDITSIKLGPAEETVYSPDIASLHNFTDDVTITVTYGGISERWTIYIEEVESSLLFNAPDVWTRVAYLSATGDEGQECGFRIRESGSKQWREVDSLRVEGAAFYAVADSLSPLTAYECQAWCGAESDTRTFTTEAEVQLPNAGFECFSNAESSKYFSFYDPSSADGSLQSKWWGSGNKGSTTVGSSYAITKPDAEERTEGSYSLKMESQYVVVKFAAGNVFSGEFGVTVGVSGGTVRMGRPFTLRPRKLALSLKYKCGKIEQKTLGDCPPDDPVQVGDSDRGVVWIALGDWDYKKYGGTPESPVEINTTRRETFFDPAGANVIAYGRFVATGDMDWTRVEIPLEYVSTSRRPTHIIVSCAASMLGDYFTGSPDSILWIDDLQLLY